MVPTHSRYVVVGAGIHGLSTAWHLARELRARGLGGGEDILVLDKTGVVITPGTGFGPSGEGFVRLSLTVNGDRLAEAVSRIEGLTI